MSGRETLFEEIKRYVRWTDADLDRLRAFHAAASPHFARISNEFYERIREHAEAHAVFTGEAQIARLQKSLVRWLDRLCSGARDEAYFAETAQIGQVHVKVGLPQRYVFTAMALIRVALHDLADRTEGDIRPLHDSLLRALDLELAIMVEVYHKDTLARLQRSQRVEQETLGRALARSERNYIQGVELAPYLIVGLDRAGAVVMFNQEAERVVGRARDEVLATPFRELMTTEDSRSPHEETLSRLLSGGEPSATFECALSTKSGNTRLIRWQVTHVPPHDEDDLAAFAAGRDVTDEQILAERTRNSEKLAAVGTLAAGLAHEIRNPLNGAQLHVTFLERGLKKSGADAETLDAVRVVGDEIKRLSALVDEFLDFARPRPLRRKHLALQTICQRVVDLASANASAATVRLRIDLPTTPLDIDIDVDKIEQVLLNLLQNAIEAMAPSGGGNLVLRVRRQPTRAVIEVEDDGPGLTNKDAPIFDAFFSTKPSGTGLGLSIAHRIVTDHGGDITVDSRPGRTVFRVTLPLS